MVRFRNDQSDGRDLMLTVLLASWPVNELGMAGLSSCVMALSLFPSILFQIKTCKKHSIHSINAREEIKALAGWLSWLQCRPYTPKLQVQSLVRAYIRINQ